MRLQDLLAGILILLLLGPSITSGVHILARSAEAQSRQVTEARTRRDQARDGFFAHQPADPRDEPPSGTMADRAWWRPWSP